MKRVLMARLRWSAFRLAAVVLVATIASAGCVGSPAPKSYPGSSGISPADPTGDSRQNYEVDGFDLCSPFTETSFLEQGPTNRSVEPGPGSCRWRGEGLTATISVQIGATLAEISNDSRYRPGRRDRHGNSVWHTLQPRSGPYRSHLFMSTGPSQPLRLLHVYVEAEEEWAEDWQLNRPWSQGGLDLFIARCIDDRMNEAPSP
jgi:hypothetical protein